MFKRLTRNRLLIVLLLLMLAVPIAGISAQTATPVPTIVPITINTNGLFQQVNTWTGSLDDVIFVGVAISIALAILTFIGSQVVKAFRGGGAK